MVLNWNIHSFQIVQKHECLSQTLIAIQISRHLLICSLFLTEQKKGFEEDLLGISSPFAFDEKLLIICTFVRACVDLPAEIS